MKPTHTPGPWVVAPDPEWPDESFSVYTDQPGHINAELAGRIGEEANARLIAAAPALRAAVAEAFDFICSRHDDEDAEEDHLIALLDAALAAADKGAP
jgi:hypothetical protein